MVEEIALNQTVLSRFSCLIKKEHLAHAYLFVGPVFVGKKETAVAIAKTLNCEQPDIEGHYCSQCASCVKIESGNHPDIHIIDNGAEESIKIEQIRNLLTQVKLMPFQAKKKVFIIRHVEKMTIESTNALLKTLEEPNASSLLILTTAVPEKILDTVRSRCHTVLFPSRSQDDITQSLLQSYGLDQDRAHFLAYFSKGCIGKAQHLQANNIFTLRDDVIDRFILGRDSEFIVKKYLDNKEKVKDVLEVLASWIRDALLLQHQMDESQLVHGDRLRELKDFSKRFTFDDLMQAYAEVIDIYKMVNENLNIKIPFLIIGERLWRK